MKIKVVGDPFSVSGYSLHCREMILAFLDHKWNVSLKLYMQDRFRDMSFSRAKEIEACIDKNNDAEVSLQIMIPPYFHKAANKNIGMFFYEATKLPDSWVKKCNEMDGIIVPSKFCYDACLNSGVTVPVKIACSYFDATEYTKTDWRQQLGINKDTFVFFSIMQWNYRKGFDVLLRSYWSAFQKIDTQGKEVVLVLKTYGIDFSDQEQQRILKDIDSLKKQLFYADKDFNGIPALPKIKLILRSLSYDEVQSMYDCFDCFVLPTRGEGWGRPILDAVAHETPIIATDFGAHTEFLFNRYYFITSSLEPPIGLNVANYPLDSRIASPSIDSTIKHMEYVFSHKQNLVHPEKTRAYQFTEGRSVKEYSQAIKEIVGV